MRIIDLTYPFDQNTLYWPGESGFKLKELCNGETSDGYYCYINQFTTSEHGGTHMDAPAHLYKGAKTIDEVELGKLYGTAVVIDISGKCDNNRDYQLVPDDLAEWERVNGDIPEQSIIIIKTGLGKYWPDRKQCLGTDDNTNAGASKLHFPGLHHTAAEWLIKKNKIKSVGIETPGIDYGQSVNFETHILLFKNDIPVFENVANVDKLPVKDFTIIALPMKIKGGSGAPLRIVAVVND